MSEARCEDRGNETTGSRHRAGEKRQALRSRVENINRCLHEVYREKDLGNRSDPIEEFVYISLTRQTHQRNALRSWDVVCASP